MSQTKTKKDEKSLFEGLYPKNAGEDFLKLWKFSFDTAFDNLVQVQDLNEKILKDMYEKGQEIQAETAKVVNDMVENTKKGQAEYKKAVEAGFKKMQEIA
jgi:polyhydroxyalkanoate synthesis regulator phasin